MLALLLVALGLGLSIFAASVGIGISGTGTRTRLRVGIVFSLFETGMPISACCSTAASRTLSVMPRTGSVPPC